MSSGSSILAGSTQKMCRNCGPIFSLMTKLNLVIEGHRTCLTRELSIARERAILAKWCDETDRGLICGWTDTY